MSPPITIYYDPKIDIEEIKQLVPHVLETYGIELKEIKKQRLDLRFYNRRRKQFNGQKLLNKMIDKKNYSFFLWMVKSDIYVPAMNFVFGLASEDYGAIVSFHRLQTSEMKAKESIHEYGHVLGLKHCQNKCVMQYSNTLKSAESKPSKLCEVCRKHIEFESKKID